MPTASHTGPRRRRAEKRLPKPDRKADPAPRTAFVALRKVSNFRNGSSPDRNEGCFAERCPEEDREDAVPRHTARISPLRKLRMPPPPATRPLKRCLRHPSPPGRELTAHHPAAGDFQRRRTLPLAARVKSQGNERCLPLFEKSLPPGQSQLRVAPDRRNGLSTYDCGRAVLPRRPKCRRRSTSPNGTNRNCICVTSDKPESFRGHRESLARATYERGQKTTLALRSQNLLQKERTTCYHRLTLVVIASSR